MIPSVRSDPDPPPPPPLPGAADWRQVLPWTAALVLPAVAGLMALAFGREASSAIAAILLVASVAAVAWVGGRWPGTAAAVVTGVVYDIGWTQPYDQLAIDQAADVVAVVLLVLVGVGLSHLVHALRGPARPR